MIFQDDDFIRPNLFLRDWMLPCLPKCVFGRDAIISISAITLGATIAYLVMTQFGETGPIWGALLNALLFWLFITEVQGR